MDIHQERDITAWESQRLIKILGSSEMSVTLFTMDHRNTAFKTAKTGDAIL